MFHQSEERICQKKALKTLILTQATLIFQSQFTTVNPTQQSIVQNELIFKAQKSFQIGVNNNERAGRKDTIEMLLKQKQA